MGLILMATHCFHINMELFDALLKSKLLINAALNICFLGYVFVLHGSLLPGSLMTNKMDLPLASSKYWKRSTQSFSSL